MCSSKFRFGWFSLLVLPCSVRLIHEQNEIRSLLISTKKEDEIRSLLISMKSEDEIRRLLISVSQNRNQTKSDSVIFSVLYHLNDVPYRGPTASTREFSRTGWLFVSFPSPRHNDSTKTAKQSQQQILRHRSWDLFFCQKRVKEEEYWDWRDWGSELWYGQ